MRGALKNTYAMNVKCLNFDIVALQETKQRGNDTLELEDNNFLNSEGENKIPGTGFLLSKVLKATVIDCQTISVWMCKIRLRENFRRSV